jgi:hypothetical protein
MHGVAPQMCGRVASPLLGRGAGGRSPGFLMPPRLAARVQTPGFLMPSRLAARVQMLLAQPPEELSAEEAEVWRLTVEGVRPDWFGPEVRPLLRAYCTQTALAQFLAQELRALAVGDKSFS